MDESDDAVNQQFVVNGTEVCVIGSPRRSLLGVLRDELGLTGAKYGCGEEQCGACVVLVDGVATPTCTTPVASVAGRAIVTIEGIACNGKLHAVQQAFLDEDALQCGYCTPGMILAVVGLLNCNPNPSERDAVAALQKHLCRCGAYRRILRAVESAAESLRREREPAPQ